MRKKITLEDILLYDAENGNKLVECAKKTTKVVMKPYNTIHSIDVKPTNS